MRNLGGIDHYVEPVAGYTLCSYVLGHSMYSPIHVRRMLERHRPAKVPTCLRCALL